MANTYITRPDFVGYGVTPHHETGLFFLHNFHTASGTSSERFVGYASDLLGTHSVQAMLIPAGMSTNVLKDVTISFVTVPLENRKQQHGHKTFYAAAYDRDCLRGTAICQSSQSQLSGSFVLEPMSDSLVLQLIFDQLLARDFPNFVKLPHAPMPR